MLRGYSICTYVHTDVHHSIGARGVNHDTVFRDPTRRPTIVKQMLPEKKAGKRGKTGSVARSHCLASQFTLEEKWLEKRLCGSFQDAANATEATAVQFATSCLRLNAGP